MKYGLLIKNLSGANNQKLEHSATDALKNASKNIIQKTTKATHDLTGKNIADKITKISRATPQTSLEAENIEHNKEITKERYISSEKDRKLLMIQN